MISLSPYSAPREEDTSKRPGALAGRHILCGRSSSRLFHRRRSKTSKDDSQESGVIIEDLPSTIQTVSTMQLDDDLSTFTVVGEESSLGFSGDIIALPKKPIIRIDTPLHKPKNAKHVLDLLNLGHDPNKRDLTHDSLLPIHSITRSNLKDRALCLETLLLHSNADVNACAAHKMTALHFAAMVGDLRCVKLLLAFGANINAISDFDQTPMNLAIAHYRETVIHLLQALGGISATFVLPKIIISLPPIHHFNSLCRYFTPDSSDTELERGTRMSEGSQEYDLTLDTIRPVVVQLHIESRFHNAYTISEEEALMSVLDRRSRDILLHHSDPEIMHSLVFQQHNGSRILSLDGGGMRALIQLEVLEELMNITGQTLTEMFDVVIATSTGALLALGIIYGKKTTTELKRYLYRLKNEVYCSDEYSLSHNSRIMDSLLRDIIGSSSLKMCDVKEPKVVVTATDIATSDLTLRFFSNCLNDEYSHCSVFNVARCTMATPTVYNEIDSFVDGCVMSNNPLGYALTRLQQHFFLRQEQLAISMVISLGTGVYNVEKKEVDPIVQSPRRLKSILKEYWQRTCNLSLLMKQSVLLSEDVSTHCSLRCRQLSIPYYRFSPVLKESVSMYETETRKLLNMVLRTRIEMQRTYSLFNDLTVYFEQLNDSYNQYGGAVGNIPSNIGSPSGLIVNHSSSETTSSGEELKKLKMRQLAFSPCQ